MIETLIQVLLDIIAIILGVLVGGFLGYKLICYAEEIRLRREEEERKG